MKKQFVGYWKTLIGYPDLWGKVPCFGCRWHFLPLVGKTMFQVEIESIGGLAWINIPAADFEGASWINIPTA